MSVFTAIPKKGKAKKCSNYRTIALISHTSKVMLKILQVRLQQYMNHELPDVCWFQERQRNQKSNCQHPLDHREFQKTIYFCLIDSAKAFDCAEHNQDNRNGVITHVEPDILEWEVKWALGSITTDKASRGDGIPVELFRILKDDAVKVLHSICQQIWKTQQWPQDWKRSV